MNYKHDYQLNTKPNLFKRIVAAIIDYGIIAIYMVFMFYLYAEPNNEGGFTVKGWPGFSIVVVWFIFTVGMEISSGMTLGNRSQNLRVGPKSDPRKGVTFGQSLKRHLLDPIDLWPFGLLGLLTIKNTAYNQRLGDLWAKTVVIDTSDPEQGLKEKTPAATTEQ
ncbi:MAG TPA: RDD family protein [Flavobacteriales bacterium]|jgi:uncharacterized RDD family membrane protein YckC|nr:RDD family protein [Flavobacteriales bacterium]HAW20991.1 RDD family protein [Flavobacteriales bacterium]